MQSNDFSVDETRQTIRIINRFILKEPLSDDELETVLREEAFQKPIFFIGKVFQFDVFARYLKNNNHVVKVNGQLHIYHDGIYVNGYKELETAMIELIPNLKKTQRREVIEYMELIVDDVPTADARYIAFANGIYDIVQDTMQPFSSSIVVTNKIPWDFNRMHIVNWQITQ